ncbi:MAG: HNH endonuclease [Candidatus Paceibacterota bacterium]|jgi:hypothetical protein
MKWSKIQKTTNLTVESYGCHDSRVKEFLRQEGGFRCVYCAIHENALGGIQAFHVEHYKPKSKFPTLEHILENLFYSCPICNRFKLNDWPAEPNRHLNNSSYPDPSKIDYSNIFNLNTNTGIVSGKYIASRYMVERLYFNRPQLILERRQYFLDQDLNKLNQNYMNLIKDLGVLGNKKSIKYLKTLAKLSGDINKLILDLKKIPSYEITDVSRKHK